MLHGKTWIAMAVILLQRLVWMPAFRHCHLSAMSIRPAYKVFMLLLIICGEIGKDAGNEIEPYAHLSNKV